MNGTLQRFYDLRDFILLS